LISKNQQDIWLFPYLRVFIPTAAQANEQAQQKGHQPKRVYYSVCHSQFHFSINYYLILFTMKKSVGL
jgi:hypothetical protein